MKGAHQKFRWGLMGAGAIARQFGLSIAQLPDHEVHSIASRNQARAETLAGALGGATRALPDYQALVASADIDAIYVATPASAHLANVSLALRAGKPVLCEKPFATTADEARQMQNLASQQKVFCMEAMWMRFIPAITRLKTRLEAGEIGAVQLLEAELGFSQPFQEKGRHFDPAQGGGALLDLGVYPLSLAWYLLGRPERGQALSSLAPSGVDAQTIINLSFPSGALASLSCSFSQRLRNRAMVAGTKGRLLTDDPLFSPGALVHMQASPPAQTEGTGDPGRLSRFIEQRPQLVQARRRFAPLLRQLLRRERKTQHLPFAGYGYQFEAIEVARCVREGRLESPVMPLSETVELMQAIDALRTFGGFDWRD